MGTGSHGYGYDFVDRRRRQRLSPPDRPRYRFVGRARPCTAAGADLAGGQGLHQRRCRHALPEERRYGTVVPDRAERPVEHRHGRHNRGADQFPTGQTVQRSRRAQHEQCRVVRRNHRRSDRHRRCLYLQRIRLFRHQTVRFLDRIPVAILPHGTAQEPRRLRHRRDAAHQREEPDDRRDGGLRSRNSAIGRRARLPSRGLHRQSDADGSAEAASRRLHRIDRGGDRRQVALYGRPLPARAPN